LETESPCRNRFDEEIVLGRTSFLGERSGFILIGSDLEIWIFAAVEVV